MSVPALELLQTVGLLDAHDRVIDVDHFSPSELAKLIAYYAEHRLTQVDNELASIAPSDGLSSLVSSFSGRTAVQPLLPSTLVFERVIVDDLVFKLHRIEHEFTKVGRLSLGFDPDEGLEPWRVTNALAFFEHLAPLIRNGLVQCLPLAELHRPPKDPVISFSEDWYRSDVPDAVHDFVHKNVIIQEMQPGPDGKGLCVLNNAPAKPVRGIMLSFQDDETISEGTFYLLHEMTVSKQLSDTEFMFAQTLPWDKPPERAQYDAWVYQSINQTIAARLRAISAEMAVADAVGAAYLTESRFEAHLCSKLGVKDGGAAPSADAINFLRANEPSLQIDSADTVLRLRTGNPGLFEQFHESLVEVSRQLHGVDDFNTRAKALLNKEIMPQVRSIESAAAKLRGSAIGGALSAGGTISLALLAGPTLPLAAVLGAGAILAAGQTLPSVTEYLSVRKSPAFLWKQIKKTNP